MSSEAKKYRAEMRAKANRLGNAKSPEKVDASSWRPGSPLHADKKTGARPVRARIYKHGGRIQGDRAPKNAGKEQRANGGALSVHDTVGENKKEKGSFHEGGYKGGGKAEKACGGGRMKDGGKAAKAKGGEVNPLLAARAKRDEPAKPQINEKLAKRTDGDAPMKSAGVALRKKGGEVEEKKSDKTEDKKEIKTAIHKHDKQMHGGKFTKGLKKGGEAEERAEKADGGRLQRDTGGDVLSALSPLAMVLKLAKGEDKPKEEPYWATEQGQKTSKEGYTGGGRAKRAKGGRAKGKTNINIIIGGGAGGGPSPNMPPPSAPVRPPPPPQNAPPPPMMGGPGGPPPGPPPGGLPPGGPPPGGPPMPPPGGPMMRAMGGRTNYMSKEAGAGSGLGRLRKARKEGQEMPVRG